MWILGLAIDYMHWQIPLSKRFRSLKLWCVIRNYGVKGLQEHVRKGVRLAKFFEELVRSDSRFEIPAARHLGLVVFRLKGDNELTEKLLKRINSTGKIHCVPAALKGKYVIRFTVTSSRTTEADINNDWAEVQKTATVVLAEMAAASAAISSPSKRLHIKEIYKRCDTFGSSLMLANSPLSPKIVNGSFAAMLDEESDPELGETFNFAHLRTAHKDSLEMRRRLRGIFMSGRHLSLDSRMDVVHAEFLRNVVSEMTTESDDSERGNLGPDNVLHEYENLIVQSPLSPLSSDRFTESDFGSNSTLAADDLDEGAIICQTRFCEKCGHEINSKRTD